MIPETIPSSAEVAVSAVARAAALLALEQHQDRTSPGIGREDVERIADECVRKAFLNFGVDLANPESVESFRETISHAKRARSWWEKAGATVWGAILLSFASGVLAAAMKYVSAGGGK